MKRLILTTALALIAANAHSFKDGITLLDACESDKTPERLMCRYYIDGAVSGMVLQAGLDGASRPFCWPDGTVNGQIQGEVISFLRKLPEWRHRHAALIISIALEVAYPCEETKP